MLISKSDSNSSKKMANQQQQLIHDQTAQQQQQLIEQVVNILQLSTMVGPVRLNLAMDPVPVRLTKIGPAIGADFLKKIGGAQHPSGLDWPMIRRPSGMVLHSPSPQEVENAGSNFSPVFFAQNL